MTTFTLDTFQWKNRLLLVFAPEVNYSAYRSQQQLLSQQQAELDDRNLLVIPVLGTGNAASQPSIDAATAAQLRQQFGVREDEFCVILIGKDGTEKRRDRQPVQPDSLYAQIDAMPMRQQEMRQ